MGVMEHSRWLKRFSKSRAGKLFDLKYEVKGIQADPNKKMSNSGAATYLAAALSIATKGTKMEEDAVELIRSLCPEYFKK